MYPTQQVNHMQGGSKFRAISYVTHEKDDTYKFVYLFTR